MKIGYTAKLAVHLPRAVCLISLLPLRTSAWGVKGHRVVARIAAKHLTPKTRAAIVAILRSDEEDIDQCRQLLSVADQLGQNYYKRNLPIVESQLQSAGVHLARFLNDIFDPKP